MAYLRGNLMASRLQPLPTKTRQYLLITVALTLRGVLFFLLGQLPFLVYLQPQSSLLWVNWAGHFGVFCGLYIISRHGYLHLARNGLFASYCSYFYSSVYFWPSNINLHYFLLLLIVAAGFCFTRHEAKQQWFWVITTSLLFLFVTTPWQATLSVNTSILIGINNLLLISACLFVFYIFTRVTHRRWQGAKQRQQNLEQRLHSLFPVDDTSQRGLWQQGKVLQYNQGVVLFADLRGYTRLFESFSDARLIAVLHRLYQQIDDLAALYHIEKIKTNGDEYMAATGIPSVSKLKGDASINHGLHMMEFATHLVTMFQHFCTTNQLPCKIRIGIASGPIMAGIIGKQKPCFDVWGQTVNIAANLEQICQADHIHICPKTAAMIRSQWQCIRHTPHMPKHPHIKETFYLGNKVPSPLSKDTNAINKWHYST
jgi:class 3 adenylate cyclase